MSHQLSAILRSLLVWHYFLLSSNTCCTGCTKMFFFFFSVAQHTIEVVQRRCQVSFNQNNQRRRDDSVSAGYFPSLCKALRAELRRTDVAVKIKINCKDVASENWRGDPGQRGSRQPEREERWVGRHAGKHQESTRKRGLDRQQN